MSVVMNVCVSMSMAMNVSVSMSMAMNVSISMSVARNVCLCLWPGMGSVCRFMSVPLSVPSWYPERFHHHIV